jgi:hypothetical protein
MNWLEFECPACAKVKAAAPGHTYKICSRCATPHCSADHEYCGVENCHGILHEAVNLGGTSRFPARTTRVRYDPKY